MKLTRVKLGLHRGLATSVLVLVSMSLPATLSAVKVEHASIVSVASRGNFGIGPSATFLPSSSRRDEGSVADEVGANRRAGADLVDVENNSGLSAIDSEDRQEASFSTASAARFDSERKHTAGRRLAAGTLGGLRILQRIFSNGQSPR